MLARFFIACAVTFLGVMAFSNVSFSQSAQQPRTLALPPYAFVAPIPQPPAGGWLEGFWGACKAASGAASQIDPKWREAAAFRGIVSNGALIEIFLNRKTGTFTVMTTKPSGSVCYIASGEGGHTVEEILEKSSTY